MLIFECTNHSLTVFVFERRRADRYLNSRESKFRQKAINKLAASKEVADLINFGYEHAKNVSVMSPRGPWNQLNRNKIKPLHPGDRTAYQGVSSSQLTLCVATAVLNQIKKNFFVQNVKNGLENPLADSVLT